MEIRLIKWRPEDAEVLAALCDGADRRFLSDRLPQPYTLQDARNWLDRVQALEGGSGVFRAVTLDGEIVDMISVEQKEDVYRKDGDLGYLLGTAQWSKGIMTQAVRQICPIAFAELDLLRITGMVYEDNYASRKVLEKNGFRLEGTMKQAIIKNGSIHDLCIYGKLKE